MNRHLHLNFIMYLYEDPVQIFSVISFFLLFLIIKVGLDQHQRPKRKVIADLRVAEAAPHCRKVRVLFPHCDSAHTLRHACTDHCEETEKSPNSLALSSRLSELKPPAGGI